MAKISKLSSADPHHDGSVSAIGVLCKAAGDPLRIQILKVLQENAYGVLELCQIFDIRQSAMSHHLKILSNAGLVATKREGTTIFYRRNPINPDADLQALQSSLFQSIDQSNLEPAVNAKLSTINQERAKASVDFFNRNVSRFEENQDLIASWSDYGESVENFLDSSVEATGSILEVGPGYGQFLGKLSSSFDQVFALDNSQQMLAECRERANQQGLTNIQFFHGDTESLQSKNLRVDAVSLNMVLHHNPSPATIIKHCANLLNSHGVLLITDLCAHDQDWVRESCGDLWLGFDPADISDWAIAAGLTEGSSLFLTQRNGFRIQLRQFKTATLQH